MELIKEKNKKFIKIKISLFGFFIIFIILFGFLLIQFSSAPSFDDTKLINIPSGYSILKTAELLEDEGIIYSKFLLSRYMQYKNILVKSGTYYFDSSIDLFSVARRISNADYGDVYKKIIIPEGSTNKQLISIIKKSPFIINENILQKLTDGKEGYLFPDTYSFLPESTESEIIETLEKTFFKKIEKIEKEKTIKKTRDEIVTMASILEKEASNNLEQKQIISGILWRRISIGMPLQVDAPFLYERGKGSAKLSNNDLQKNSPYNTYTNKGLPPTPIGNPGYDSLYAASHPKKSDYLFYIHDKKGIIHYGKNHNEHIKNIRLYLK